MTIKLSQPQATLLSELYAAGTQGVFKSIDYTPAGNLVTFGYAKWARKFDNGRSGCLVITQKGIEFKRGGV